MQIQVTDGYITGYAQTGGFVDGIEVPDDFLGDMTPEEIRCCRFENGAEVLDESRLLQQQEAGELEQLREMRAIECFPVVNRGKPWYDRLTPQQQSELDSWYQSWLDVTISHDIPQMPAWIRGGLKAGTREYIQ